jgi:CRISPR/Cas system CMR subunit Cmr4 (Cas7 group RAMP superfamily)
MVDQGLPPRTLLTLSTLSMLHAGTGRALAEVALPLGRR